MPEKLRVFFAAPRRVFELLQSARRGVINALIGYCFAGEDTSRFTCSDTTLSSRGLHQECVNKRINLDCFALFALARES